MTILLPIDALLPELIQLLETEPLVLVQAPPGTGKSTRLPHRLLQQRQNRPGQIVLLQPRRVAVRAVARFIAAQHQQPLGEEVGYQVRFDRVASARTKLMVQTEGILLRQLLRDPFLESVDLVIFDEFHERHLETDLALAMVRQVQQTVRPELRILVMSATLDAGWCQQALGNPPIVTATLPHHAVEIDYLPQPAGTVPLDQLVEQGVLQMLSLTDGDILVFLPGMGEIRQCQRRLFNSLAGKNTDLVTLYGDLSSAEQDLALQPGTRRRIVLATNLAETSLTIPGVTGVVDSGLARLPRFETSTGLNLLSLEPISQASATQRAGRAGRLGPGRCLRLWTDAAHRTRAKITPPEIQRVDLSGAILLLHAWGERNALQFPWIEAPLNSAIETANSLLSALGAIHNGALTPLGAQLADYPLEPRLARLIIAGAELGVLPWAALAAAMISEGLSRTGGITSICTRRSDVLDAVLSIAPSPHRVPESPREGAADSALYSLLRTARQLVELGRSGASEQVTGALAEERFLQAIALAFPDRIARRRTPQSRQGVLPSGRGVQLSHTSKVDEGELFACLDLNGVGSEAQVRTASLVRAEWLCGPLRTEQTELDWDERAERVQARKRTRWGGLLLEDVPIALPPGEGVATVLLAAALRTWPACCPTGTPWESTTARLRCLADWLPDLNWPALDDAALQSLLPELTTDCRSMADLRHQPWTDALLSRLTSPQRQSLERDAPERLLVPSGSRVALHYEAGRPPILAVRIQEIFGWRETPRIAQGRVKVLLHLLAPNHRPQQITDDLPSFWANGYPVVRGELRRRYPKHAWPEDPRAALPEHRPGRPRN